MATAMVQLDEEAMIRGIISELALPKGVKFKKIEESEMWDGDPAWRIYFSVSKSIPLTKKRVGELNTMTRNVSRQIRAAQTSRFPLYHFLEVK